MSAPEPTLVEDPADSRYELRIGDEVAGFVTYHRFGDQIAFLHTEIDPAFEGRGLGSTLVRGVLDAARQAGNGVSPYCPFVRRFIGRHPDYLDLVSPDDRERFEL